MPDFAWFPEYQADALMSLGYADGRIYAASRMSLAYTERGALDLSTEVIGNLSTTRVSRVRPIPAALPRIFAEGLNQLRATIEHALFAEVEQALGRPLSEGEARAIEFPSVETPVAFDRWLAHGVRRTITPLRVGQPLAERIRSLQPFVASDPRQHPSWVLAALTNNAKHRSPNAFGVLLGAIVPDHYQPGVQLAERTDQPLAAGDVLLEAPLGTEIAVNIWPSISVQRPGDGSWHQMTNELELIEDWVRTVALPTIIAGSTDVDHLPPGAETERGYGHLWEALSTAGTRTASERIRRDSEVQMLRLNTPDLMTRVPGLPQIAVDAAERWVEGLSDEELVDRMSRLAVGDPEDVGFANMSILSEMVEEALISQTEPRE